MPESIKEVFDRVLQPYQYRMPPETATVVTEVVRALEEREANIADMLRHQARTAGMSQPLVEQALIEAGLSMRQAEPVNPPYMADSPTEEPAQPSPDQRSFMEELRRLLSQMEQMMRDARDRFHL